MRSVIRRLSLVAVFAAASACGGDDDPAGPGTGDGANTVTMGATTFSPAAITIDQNESVTWSNTSGVLHNVTFTTSGSPANIPDHTSGNTARAFANVGTYNYNCTNHEGMSGSVTVQ